MGGCLRSPGGAALVVGFAAHPQSGHGKRTLGEGYVHYPSLLGCARGQVGDTRMQGGKRGVGGRDFWETVYGCLLACASVGAAWPFSDFEIFFFPFYVHASSHTSLRLLWTSASPSSVLLHTLSLATVSEPWGRDTYTIHPS